MAATDRVVILSDSILEYFRFDGVLNVSYSGHNTVRMLEEVRKIDLGKISCLFLFVETNDLTESGAGGKLTPSELKGRFKVRIRSFYSRFIA